ncbi:hypothetical protein [Methylobacterium sp. Leaf466]|uniref:hypothetical protein n=1 Tax=Methylobacterium sp. Leaf466 TaxID=1736386 RepID=UPI0006FDBAA8|nr:hypothetical protein [Methylobacterium sp. Leaf466]KQT77702.1 hypothetical protein ASG59_10165 [Methylobacterium sp. Leaf466]
MPRRPTLFGLGACALVAVATVAASSPVAAGGYGGGLVDAGPMAGVGGRAAWNRPWEYDSGSDNDRRPELPYYQQGRGQQTGGPARNLLPDDGLHLIPR